MRVDADVVVVGAGVIGLAAARALARRGRGVVVLDRFEAGHARGSSHGTSRIFRLAYADRRYVRLALEALPLWRELERESGVELLRTVGALDVGPGLEPFARALRAEGVEAELLAPEEARARFPAFALEGSGGLYQPDGGVLFADRALEALRAGAAARGAELRDEVAVTAVDAAADGVVVETATDEIRGRAALVAAGAWAPELLEPLGSTPPLLPTRETIVHFRVGAEDGLPTLIDHEPPEDPRLPAVPLQAPYALPSPGVGLKTGIHRAGRPADPDEPGEPDAAVVDAVVRWLGRRLPHDRLEPVLAETCLYTNTPDERFILERRGRVVVAAACSGHAFKFAPALGERLAELAAAAGP